MVAAALGYAPRKKFLLSPPGFDADHGKNLRVDLLLIRATFQRRMPRRPDIHQRRALRRAARRLLRHLETDVEAGLQMIDEHCGPVALDRIVVCLVVNALALLGRKRGHGRVTTTLKAIERAHTYQEKALLEASSQWVPENRVVKSTIRNTVSSPP